jgi:large repetitive protein
MKPQKFSRLSGSVASAAALFMFSNALLVRGTLAQSTESATAVSLPAGTTAAPFLVAPSFALASAPSSVAMGDLNQDGKPDLVTTDVISGKVTVFLGAGNGKFATGVEYATGSHPGAVAVADLNGDGHEDVIVADETKGTISIFSSNGNGTLQLKQSLAAGIDPAFMAVGDFNGDGKIDLAVAARSAASLAVLLNDGKGNLQKPTLTALHKAPASLTVAQFNNDGHASLALGNADGTVSILLGTGSGAFHSLPDVAVASGSLSSIVVGDFNRDGNVDLAVTQSGVKTLTVLLGKGNGVFASPASYTVGNNPVSSLVTDLDGDGIPDLVVVNQGSNTYSVLGGIGDGTFKSSLDYVVGNGPVAAVAGQFDVNGHVDLAVINPSSQSVTVPLGNGDGTFKAARSYLAGIEPRAVASADLNGDKLADLVVTNYCGSDSACGKGGSVAVFLANSDGSYRLSNTYQLGAGPVSVALADVNGDKFPDIVALNRGDKTVSVLLAKGDGSFEQPYTFPITDSPIAVAVGDFNKDGKIDLAVLGDCGAATCSQPGSVEVLQGHGDGSFSSLFTYPTGYSPVSIGVGDLNQDKNLDIVVTNRCGKDASCKSAGTATVLLGGSAGKFKAAADVSLGNSPSSIALGDMSGRGVSDLLVTSSLGNSLAVLRGNGDGTFQAPAAYKVGNSPGSVVVADFNGDGKPDVAVANILDSTVSVLFGKGDGTLNSSSTLSVGTGPVALTTVAGANGAHASLVTANGNTGSATPGTDFTVLANMQPELIGSGTTTVTVAYGTPAPNPSVVDQPVALTVTVTPTPASANVPSSTVTFLSKGVAIPDCGTAGVVMLDGTGKATCTTSSLLAGSDGLTATYIGDSNFAANAVSNSLPQVVTAAVPTVALSFQAPSASTSPYGTPVTVIATIGANGPVVPAGGTVTFTDAVPAPATPLTCTPAPSLTGGSSNSTATCSISSSFLTVSALHSINATYTAGADTNFSTNSSTAPLGLTITKVAPTVSVTIKAGSNNPSNVGTAVTFTATIAGVSGFAAPTGGTVSFFDGASPITCTNPAVLNSAGSTSTEDCTTSSLNGGTHIINATYNTGADPNYSTASNAAGSGYSQVMNAISTSTVITSSEPASSNVDDIVTFTATVTPTSTVAAAPSGTVTFTLHGSTLCTVSTKTGAVWTCSTQALVAFADVIGATYSGDANYAGSIATPFTQNVNPIAATTSLVATPSTSSVNQTVNFTATVKPLGVASPVVLPGGSVTIKQGATTLCSAGLSGSPSTASCSSAFSAANLSPGISITAVYSPDANFTAGTPGQATQIVQPSATTAAVSSSTPNPSNVNDAVVFTSTLTPQFTGAAVPQTGQMVLTDTTTSTTVCSVAVTSGVVPTCPSFKFTTSGAHIIKATFTTGDPNFSSSPASAPFTQNVGASGTTVFLSSSPTASTVNQQVTFSTTVTSSSGGSAVPQGTVTYMDTLTNKALCPPVTLVGGAVPNCQAPLLTAATHTIVANYTSADSNFQSGTSQIVNQIVSQGTPTVALAALPSASSVDQLVTFTATITPLITGATVPTGTVNFTYAPNGNTQVLCNTNVSTTTTTHAACTAPLTAAGTFAVTAAYSGDLNFAAGNLGSTNITVSKTGTTVSTPVISPAAPAVNQSVTLSATVTSAVNDAGLTLPGGTITFSDTTPGSGGPLCTTSPAAGGIFPSCTAAFSTHGTRTVTATYNSDSNFTASVSAPAAPVVGAANSVAGTPVGTPNPSIVNQPVMFTATIAAQTVGASAPQTGNMAFSDTSTSPATAMCSASVASGVVGSCSYSFPTAGTHNVTATFNSGDANFKNSPASGILPQVVTASTTKVTLTTTPAIIPANTYVNQTLTFNSTVTSSTSGGTAVPQGTVVYQDTATSPATVLCRVTLASVTSINPAPGTVPSCTVPSSILAPLNAGPHAIEAVFANSNTDFSPATSAITTVTIAQNTPTVSLALSGSPAPSAITVDQSVTYTATIAQNPTVITTGNLSTAYPTGTVSFTFAQAGGSTGSPCTAAPVTTVAGVSTATCTFSFQSSAGTTAGGITTPPYKVTATYNGDINFANTPTTINQTVGLTATLVSFNTPDPTNPGVNQPITFTASVAKPQGDAGLTLPTGSISFSDTTISSPGVSLCTATVTAATGIASCTAPLHSQGVHTITATYNGDTNFSVSSSPQTETVIESAPVVKLTAATSTVVATQSLNFIATVSPTVTGTGAKAPSGTITFTSSDGSMNSCSPAVTSPGDGTITNSCLFAFLSTTSGPVTVTATFTTNNTDFSSGTATLNINVQNFAFALSPSAPINLTQGYATGKDPIAPVTIQASVTPVSGYNDPINLTCQVRNSNQAIVTTPSCVPVPAALPGNGSAITTLAIAASANTPVDAYSVILTATDNAFPSLTQQQTLMVDVISESGTISLSAGSSATQSISFDTAPPPPVPPATTSTPAATLDSFTCGKIIPIAVTGSGNAIASDFTCVGPSGTVAVTGNATTAAITISVVGTTSAANIRNTGSGSIVSAAFWGVPLMALLAWVARRNSPRRNFFRFLGMLLLVVGFSNTIGCGGSFTRPPTVTGGPPVGSYLIQVVATDSNKIEHYAIVPLVVN